jgi:hypothetical protein
MSRVNQVDALSLDSSQVERATTDLRLLRAALAKLPDLVARIELEAAEALDLAADLKRIASDLHDRRDDVESILWTFDALFPPAAGTPPAQPPTAAEMLDSIDRGMDPADVLAAWNAARAAVAEDTPDLEF